MVSICLCVLKYFGANVHGAMYLSYTVIIQKCSKIQELLRYQRINVLAETSRSGVVSIDKRGQHEPDCRIQLEPECLTLSGSNRSRILLFNGAGLDLKLYLIQLTLDFKAKVCFLF